MALQAAAPDARQLEAPKDWQCDRCLHRCLARNAKCPSCKRAAPIGAVPLKAKVGAAQK